VRGPKALPVELTDEQSLALHALLRRHSTPQQMALRAQIILDAARGRGNAEIARSYAVATDTVRLWRRRWMAFQPIPLGELSVEERFHDAPRLGRPPRITAEQVCRIVAMACEAPEQAGRPITHWTGREIADEVIRRGIVDRISPRHAARILSERDLKPHLVRSWLNAERDERFQALVVDVCQVYHDAPRLAERFVRVLSTDEMTGVQALERKYPTLEMTPGRSARREAEYTRHGTRCFIVSRDVATGQVVAPSVGPTRTEQDFVAHIRGVVATDAEAKQWHFVADNLNTHCSGSLVRYVAEVSGIDAALGKKGKSGVLKSLKTRAAFLRDVTHRVVFHYTPKHASWMNQIEIWFSILARKVLKRGSFTSVEDLRAKVLAFIAYYNRTMAKPFRWNYGKPLRV
jgi:transposase